MNIQRTIIHSVPSLHVGGVNRSLIANLENLSRGRHRHIVCVLGNNLLLAPDLEALGIEVVSLGHRGSRDSFRTLNRFRRLVFREDADVLHNHQVLGRAYGGLVARCSRIPAIATLHTMPTGRWRGKFGLVMRLTDIFLTTKFVAVSEAVACAHIDVYPEFLNRIVVIHNGAVIPAERSSDAPVLSVLRRSLALPTNAHIILNVGRMVPEKDQHILVAVMTEVTKSHPSAVLLIAGYGHESERVQLAVNEANLGASVRLLGRREDVPALLEIADLVVVSSVTEGFSMAVIEAMASGRAIVGTNIAAVSEAIRDGLEGLLVPPRDVKAFTEAIRSLLEDPAKRAAMGTAGRARAISSFSASATAEELERLYESVGRPSQ